MAPRTQTRTNKLVNKSAQLAKKNLGAKEGRACADFLKAFYANVPPVDIESSDAESLYGTAASFWAFAQKRQPCEPLIGSLTRVQETHGWDPPHTVIEVVTDDMPFLVDS